MEKIKVKRIFLANAIEVAGAGCTALYPNIPRFFNHYPDWAVLQDLSTKCFSLNARVGDNKTIKTLDRLYNYMVKIKILKITTYECPPNQDKPLLCPNRSVE